MSTISQPLRHKRVQRGLLALAIVAAGITVIWWIHFRPYISTEDARIATSVAQIAPNGSGGRVEEILVSEGQYVQIGEVLVRLDSENEKALVQRAEATLNLANVRVRAAEATLALEERLVNSGQKGAEAGIVRAKANVDLMVHGASPEELARARAELSSAQARAAENTAALARAESLSKQGVVTMEQVEHARSLDSQTQEAVKQAQSTLDELTRGTRTEAVAMARGELSQAHARQMEADAGAERIALKREEIEEARSIAKQAHADLEIAQLALDRRTLRSSLDGVVSKVISDPGDYVATGQAAVVITDMKQCWINANIEETSIGQIHEGQHVDIELDEGGKLEGRVSVVSHHAASQFALIPADNAAGNFTKVVQRIPIRVALDPNERDLRVGQSVVLRIRVL